MHDSGHKKHAVVGGYTKSASTLEAERRTSDRQMFTATAEVVEFATGARFSTKTMDIDTEAHKIYLPTAELEETKAGSGGRPKPGTFMVVVVARGGRR